MRREGVRREMLGGRGRWRGGRESRRREGVRREEEMAYTKDRGGGS